MSIWRCVCMNFGLLNPYHFGKRLLYLIETSGIDINKRGFTTILSSKLFKEKIIEYTNQTNDEIEQAKQRDHVRKRIDMHLKLESADKVSGIWLHRYCDYFKCSSDFLFGYIELPTHNYTDIQKETGLSEEALKRIVTPKGNLFLDTLITSNEFYEIDTYFSQLETVINHFNSCYKSLKQCEEKAQSITKGTTEYQENNELYFSLMHSTQRWDAEQTSNIYMMGILFGKLLDEYKKKNLINTIAPDTN